MPTEPYQPILDRAAAQRRAADVIAAASPLLRELVNVGTRLVQRFELEVDANDSGDHAIVALYLHILEMTDAVEVLITAGSATPCEALLRSALEALFSLDYICETDTDKRAAAWVVEYIHRRLETFARLDLRSYKGRSFRRAILQDPALRDLPLPAEVEGILQSERSRWDDLLSQPQFREAEAEFQATLQRQRAGGRYGGLDWYSLYNGPTSIRALADHLGRLPEYDLLYRAWSEIAHANDVSHHLLGISAQRGDFTGLRRTSEIADIAGYAERIFRDATRIVMHAFYPDDDLSTTYTDEVGRLSAQLAALLDQEA